MLLNLQLTITQLSVISLLFVWTRNGFLIVQKKKKNTSRVTRRVALSHRARLWWKRHNEEERRAVYYNRSLTRCYLRISVWGKKVRLLSQRFNEGNRDQSKKMRLAAEHFFKGFLTGFFALSLSFKICRVRVKELFVETMCKTTKRDGRWMLSTLASANPAPDPVFIARFRHRLKYYP